MISGYRPGFDLLAPRSLSTQLTRHIQRRRCEQEHHPTACRSLVGAMSGWTHTATPSGSRASCVRPPAWTHLDARTQSETRPGASERPGASSLGSGRTNPWKTQQLRHASEHPGAKVSRHSSDHGGSLRGWCSRAGITTRPPARLFSPEAVSIPLSRHQSERPPPGGSVQGEWPTPQPRGRDPGRGQGEGQAIRLVSRNC